MESATSDTHYDPDLETEKAWVAREEKQTHFPLPTLGHLIMWTLFSQMPETHSSMMYFPR